MYNERTYKFDKELMDTYFGYAQKILKSSKLAKNFKGMITNYHNNMDSFIRQLEFHGFINEFEHEMLKNTNDDFYEKVMAL